MIIRDERLYDADLDRFFLQLPIDGLRSPHSLRAYGYDILVWLRFLEDARRKSVWQADRSDVGAFHRARRRKDASFRIAATSWNRGIAALDRLYRWGQREGLVQQIPFTYREVWARGSAGRRARVVNRNEAYEGVAKDKARQFITLDEFRQFRDVGLKGLLPDGRERQGARDRNGARNALFAELLVSTGLRLEEASSLFACEIAPLDISDSNAMQVWFALPPAITKGDRGRSILIPINLISRLADYIRIERAAAVSKFLAREGWTRIADPILVYTPERGATRLKLTNSSTASLSTLSPEERSRVVICNADGRPMEPAALWLTEVGAPVKPNTWEAAFARASQRCRNAGVMLNVSPHHLRHSFATHMLSMLIERHLQAPDDGDRSRADGGYRRLLGDPLQQVQRLLGHKSLETTQVYLDHLASRNATIDDAVSQLLKALEREYEA